MAQQRFRDAAEVAQGINALAETAKTIYNTLPSLRSVSDWYSDRVLRGEIRASQAEIEVIRRREQARTLHKLAYPNEKQAPPHSHAPLSTICVDAVSSPAEATEKQASREAAENVWLHPRRSG